MAAAAALSTFGDSNAAIALGELKAHCAPGDLKQALNDTPEVSFAAAKALTRLGDTGGPDVMIAVLAGERKDAPGMFTNAMRDAKDRLHHPEGLFVMGTEDAAVAYLAKYPDPCAVQLLEWALDDDNQFVRLEAAKALGDRGNSGSIQTLDKLLDDKHNIVRDMAAVSILGILDRDGEPGTIASGPVQQPKTK